MHRIEIDADVYAELEKHVKGFEQPNDVLRRLLLDPSAVHAVRPAAAGQPGRLSGLLASGLVKVGDPLAHHRPRKGELFEATVAEDGWVQTEKGLYAAPSPALGELVGSQIDGWHSWVHVPSGKTLRELRKQAAASM